MTQQGSEDSRDPSEGKREVENLNRIRTKYILQIPNPNTNPPYLFSYRWGRKTFIFKKDGAKMNVENWFRFWVILKS